MRIPTTEEVTRELARRNFGEYVELVHDGRYTHGRFTRYLTDKVQEFIEAKTGNAYDILVLSVPPQHSKSTTITESLPAWYLGKYPTHRVVEISYNDDFAKLFTRRNHEKIERYGWQLFCTKIGTPDTANEFQLDNGVGSFISRGIDSGITGRPCELMIIDDPIKNRSDADSETMRAKLYDEWLNSYKSRLAVGAKVIVIMTRWHKQDLAGQLIQTERNVTVINFPVECLTESDALGRSLGDTLFPEPPVGKDKAWWNDFKQSYITTQGSRALNALYYGTPSSDEGGIFRRSWFMASLYKGTPDVGYTVISVDATFKDGKNSDFVSIQAWGKMGSDCYLLHRVKRIMGFVDTVEEVRKMISRFPDYNAIYIEDKANGSAIIDVLRRKYRAVIPVQPEGGKEARASAIAPMVEALNVHLKDTDGDMIDECCDFPNSDHDDDVDCMSQALNKLRNIIVLPNTVKAYDEYDPLEYEDQLESVLGYTGR
jgi:predicted phage terminase large subunit-like protein